MSSGYFGVRTRFPKKLAGAKAHLFASICLHLVEATEIDCNATPNFIPIFSWLSPQQRLTLISEVARGLLCPGAPLPPETIHHYATYLAIIEILKIELEVETDGIEFEDIGEDLLPDSATRRSYKNRHKPTREESAENMKNDYVNEKLSHKSKKHFKKSGSNIDPLVAAHETFLNTERSNSGWSFEQLRDIHLIFDGGPASANSRLLNRGLTESNAFKYRLLCDKAFQEDETVSILSPKQVNFNWKSFDCEKFCIAVDILFVTFEGSVNAFERELVCGEIDESTYANKSNYVRIRAVKKLIKDVREKFELNYDPKKLSLPQREIVAICSHHLYCKNEHKPWIEEFAKRLKSRNADIEQPGNYDIRLAVHREIISEGLFEESLSTCYTGLYLGDDNWREPEKFKGECDPIKVCEICYTFDEEKLLYCSKCSVVLYCSRECQGNSILTSIDVVVSLMIACTYIFLFAWSDIAKDWPKHKKVCADLAIMYKEAKSNLLR